MKIVILEPCFQCCFDKLGSSRAQNVYCNLIIDYFDCVVRF
jgi:hypothetical protein